MARQRARRSGRADRRGLGLTSASIRICGMPQSEKSPSELIDARIEELGDWRGETLARLRALIKEADPDVVEEWKWRGVPTWYHDGHDLHGRDLQGVVKMTFAKGASLEDPSGLFNSSLEGNVRRAIDFHEGEDDRRGGVQGPRPRGRGPERVQGQALTTRGTGTCRRPTGRSASTPRGRSGTCCRRPPSHRSWRARGPRRSGSRSLPLQRPVIQLRCDGGPALVIGRVRHGWRTSGRAGAEGPPAPGEATPYRRVRREPRRLGTTHAGLHGHLGDVLDRPHHRVAHLGGDVLRLLDGGLGRQPDLDLAADRVADPARAHVSDLAHRGHACGRAVDAVDHAVLDAVERSEPDDLDRLPDDPRITTEMSRPAIGSARSKPSATPMTPTTTARLVKPSIRAW